MVNKPLLALAALAAALLALGLPAGGDAKPKPKPKPVKLTANLKGKHVEPGPGDPDGSGKLKLKIRMHKKRNLCYVLDVQGLGGVREARIRTGARFETGPGLLKVFKASEPVTGEGVTEDCVKVRKRMLRRLKRDPGAYYADVVNAGYPDGALRGQLRKRG